MKELENIKSDLSEDPVMIQSHQLNTEDDYKFTSSYVGKIVNNNDKTKRGACQIRVSGVFSSQIQDLDLPWAFPLQSFIGGKAGSFIVPPVGAIVRVIFKDGDIYQPQYDCKELDELKLPVSRLEDYPNTLVMFETDNKDSFTINTVKKIAKFKHSSGNTLVFNRSKIELQQLAGPSIVMDEIGNIEIKQPVGATIKIDKLGNITIDTPAMLKLKAAMITESTTANLVIPTGTGCFCAIPYDPLTGLPHTGQQAV